MPPWIKLGLLQSCAFVACAVIADEPFVMWLNLITCAVSWVILWLLRSVM